jgi:uncharacterized membrane protein YeiH
MAIVPSFDPLHWLYLVAIVAEAMTAALAAGKRSMDWFGVCVLGCVTALGGGSTRDVLLGHHPLSWVEHPEYLAITAGAAFATILIAGVMHRLNRLFLLLDAIGLVVFTVIGCNVAMSLSLPTLLVVASGMITGCVGGVLRDMLCADIPLLFRSELYATVSILTGVVYVAGLAWGVNHNVVLVVAMSTGLILRLLAIRFEWSMPKFIYTRDLH